MREGGRVRVTGRTGLVLHAFETLLSIECVLCLYRMCSQSLQNVFSVSIECVLDLYRMCSLSL
jgi:hypothetical protein